MAGERALLRLLRETLLAGGRDAGHGGAPPAIPSDRRGLGHLGDVGPWGFVVSPAFMFSVAMIQRFRLPPATRAMSADLCRVRDR